MLGLVSLRLRVFAGDAGLAGRLGKLTVPSAPQQVGDAEPKAHLCAADESAAYLTGVNSSTLTRIHLGLLRDSFLTGSASAKYRWVTGKPQPSSNELTHW
jgi:hypothetical protein